MLRVLLLTYQSDLLFVAVRVRACVLFVFFVSIPKSSTAALHGNMAVAELVMDRMTLPLDHQDACGQTALHNAIAGGNPRMVELLLAKGASVWLTDKVGHTAGQFLK